MSLNSKETKCFTINLNQPLNYLPSTIWIIVSGIHRAVLENNLKEVKRLVETEECVNIKENPYDFTPLHLAVIKNNVEILDYLLSRHDIEVDTKCIEGDTPLKTATDLGAYDLVEKLIEAGANVNLPDDEDVSPLHISVSRPDICHILIRNGADIDAVDSKGLTALHRAVRSGFSETVHMLLYYNADVNLPDNQGYTSFMYALIFQKIETQRFLLDYVDDFNAVYTDTVHFGTLLSLVLLNESFLVREIVERGAIVNYADSVCFSDRMCPFVICTDFVRDETIFKIVWDRLRCYETRRPINMCKLFEITEKTYLEKVLAVIIESDNLNVAVDSFTRSDFSFCAFVQLFIQSGVEMTQLVVLTYRLLEYGYQPTIDDIHNVFYEYRPCELRGILPYMDIDYRAVAHPETKTYLRLVFDLDFDVVVLIDGLNSGDCVLTSEEMVLFLGHFRDPRLVNILRLKFGYDEYLSSLPKVPSLVELARSEVRKYIRDRFKVTNICQFHTLVDYFDIPSFYKDVLTYKRKIYNVKM